MLANSLELTSTNCKDNIELLSNLLMPFESVVELVISAMPDYPLCQAHNCREIANATECAGMLLCDHHKSYILFIRSLIEAQVEDGEISESEIEYILREEGKALKDPVPNPPELILIEGGKRGDNNDEEAGHRKDSRRQRTRR